MPKRLLSYLIICTFVYLLIIPPFTYAQVNMGDKWTTATFETQARALKGGTITLMTSPTDYKRLQAVFAANDSLGAEKVNIVLRPYKAGQAFTESDAKAMVATIGKISTSTKITLMPWNEPNDYGIESNGIPTSQLATQVALVQKTYYDSLVGAGLKGKVTLLSPMFNLWNAEGDNGGHIGAIGFVNSVKDAATKLGFNFMDKLDGWAVNWYTDPKTPNQINGKSVIQYLNDLGVPSDKKVWGVETGTIVNGAVSYDKAALKTFLDNFYNTLSSDPTLATRLGGFSIFTYDPLGNKTIFLDPSKAPELYAIFAKMKEKGLLSDTQVAAFNEAAYKAWLATSGIIECTDSKGELIGFAPTQDQCKAYAASPYSLERTVDGSGDTATAYSEPVKLIQTGRINSKNPTATFTRGGFFQEFQDNTIPFAKTVLSYLAGPFVAEFGSDEKRANAVNNPRLEDVGPYSRLTPLYIQNQMRQKFLDNCINKIYTKNECTTIDPDSKEKIDISQISPPPSMDVTAEYSAWVTENPTNSKRWYMIPFFTNPDTIVKKAVSMNACPPGVADAQKETLVDSSVPYVSALKDVSEELYNMFTNPPQNTNPAGARKASIIAGPVQNSNNNIPPLAPTILAANQVPDPDTFNPFVVNFTPKITQTGENKFNVCWEIQPSVQKGYEDYNFCDWGFRVNVSVGGKYYASAYVPRLSRECFQWKPKIGCDLGGNNYSINVNAVSAENIEVGLQITDGSCTGKLCQTIDFRQRISIGNAPSVPTCDLPPSGGKNPNGDEDPVVLNPDHILLREPHKDLNCKKWADPGTEAETCVDGDVEYKVEDPVWAEIKYPFINTIHKYLAGANGIFTMFRPPEKEKDSWNEPAESKISYCFTDYVGPITMIQGGELEVWQKDFDKPPARCDDNTSTKVLNVYPPLLGGIENAKEWIFSMFNAAKTSDKNTIQKLGTEDFSLGPSRIQTAIDAKSQNFTKDKAKPVTKGEQIGLMGNTGLSTGPHLHFAVYNYKLGDKFVVNQNLLNPCDYLSCNTSNNTVSGGTLSVPMNNPVVTQWFGQTPDSSTLYNGEPHRGIDLVNSDTKILAAESGKMFKITGGSYLGNGVVIFHSNGTMSLYWHLQ